MDSYFGYLLYQSNWYVFTTILLVGIVLSLIPYRYEKLRESAGKDVISFIAMMIIFIGALNLGYWASDNNWGRNQVNQDRTEEIQQLQQMNSRKR